MPPESVRSLRDAAYREARRTLFRKMRKVRRLLGLHRAVSYNQSIIDAMAWLGEQPDTIFVGQTVVHGGSFFAASLERVPMNRRLEFPLAEEMQLGASLGLALSGENCVVSIYPRIDFLLLAMNQLVNHIDKIGVMSDGKMRPRIIIRTAIGPKEPLDGGPQHTGNYVTAIKAMLTTVNVYPVLTADIAVEMYQHAYKSGGVWLFVEEGEAYSEKEISVS